MLAAERACALAETWLLQHFDADQPVARIDGRPASLQQSVQRSVELLANSRSPLIYGLSRSSTPGQRSAVRLADRLGATIDTTASTCHAPSIMALQQVGESTCSLGETRNRSDLIVYWGSNPVHSHPRHLERIVDAAGQWIPGGRPDRFLIVVDTKWTSTAELADAFIQVRPGGDFELIWLIRSYLKGVLPASRHLTDAASYHDGQSSRPLDVARLANRLIGSRYGTIFFGLGLTRCFDGRGAPHANVEALLRMATDLNAHTRFVVRRMRVPGDVAGADSVLCWQTGFPFSVNLARGYPRYNPGEYTAGCMLERGEVDVAVLVGSEGVAHMSPSAQRELERIPTIVLENPGVTSSIVPTVQFTTAIYGIHAPGTAYRMDEVPIPLQGFLPSHLPTDHDVLHAILDLYNVQHEAVP